MVKKIHRPETRFWNELRPTAQALRRNLTPAEKIMWQLLRDRRFKDFKFRRDHPVDRFLVDFCCPKAALIIEVDGPVHDHQKEEDQKRQEYLTEMGYHVIRFTNDQVIQHLDDVLTEVTRILEQRAAKQRKV